ncbi:hypothetical protein HJD18_04420 [Thermoleophilia bacterium SCSIO 60948]|nr:hypothetical protein HJD18_04420 [Thermoleophilia bacterium SCSIO 60948]
MSSVLQLAQVAQDSDDLLPYLALLIAGFLIGAWGQAAKFQLATAMGIVLIMAAIVLFILFAIPPPPRN